MKQKNFPYPVLGNRNDISGEFIPELTYTIKEDYVEIKCKFKTTNDYIFNLIKNTRAKYFIEVECGSTFYRRLETTNNDDINIKIESNLLKEKVEVQFYICSVAKIENYHPEGTHSVFDNEIFNIEVGDILALGGTVDFIVAKEFDPLKAPISSIIRLVKSESRNEGDIRVIYDNEKIIVELSKKDYEIYSQIKNNSIEILHSALVLPILVDAIYEANKGDDTLGVWVDKLKQICNERKINMDDPLSAAQIILNNPISRTFKWRKKTEEIFNE